MARKPRIHEPGGFYHAMLRGNGGDAIFFTPQDQPHPALVGKTAEA